MNYISIGGDFEFDLNKLSLVNDNIYDYLKEYNTIYLNSGRSAIYLLNNILPNEFGEILLPKYICRSIIESFKDKFKINFYNIKINFEIDMQDLKSKLTAKTKAIFIINYFGFLQKKYIIDTIKSYNITIIEDTTHSIFTNKNAIGDYCVCSLRKWFPVSGGGVVYSKKDLNIDSLNANFNNKFDQTHLMGMILKTSSLFLGKDLSNFYLDLFNKSNNLLDCDNNINLLSDFSKFILNCLSINDIIDKRKTNFIFLSLNIYNNTIKKIFDSLNEECPFFFPVYCNKRDELRRYLIQNSIYCPIHWPIDKFYFNRDIGIDKIINNILSIPIDQRYNEIDMKYISEIVNNFIGDENNFRNN